MRYSLLLIGLFLNFTSCNSSVNDLKEMNCDAKEILEKAISIMNFSVDGSENLDSIRGVKTNIALNLINESLICDSTFVRSYFWKATFLIQNHNYSDALESINVGIKKSTNEHDLLPKLYQMRGVINYNLDKKNIAKIDFKKSIDQYEQKLKSAKNKMTHFDIVSNMVTLNVYLDNKEKAIELINEHDDGTDLYDQLFNSLDSLNLDTLISKI